MRDRSDDFNRAASPPFSQTPPPVPRPMNVTHAPALLLMAEYNGTLAAARCLARHGSRITVATDNILAPARWSKSVSRVESCPSFGAGPTAIAEWLIRYSARQD